MKIAIDASNIRGGGGKTHLVQLLTSLSEFHEDIFIYLFCDNSILQLQPNKRIFLIEPDALKGNSLTRLKWQYFVLPGLLRTLCVDILVAPGGLHSNKFHPVVTICQNMLPFQFSELFRYGFSFVTIRLLILRYLQGRSFKNSDGIIFLSNYAKENVLGILGGIRGQIKVIPHGVSKYFFNTLDKVFRSIEDCHDKPFKLVYVSIIDQYKHHVELVTAFHNLRLKTGWNITLDLIGGHYPKSLRNLKKSISKTGSDASLIRVVGEISYSLLPQILAEYDAAVFASSCENLPNIVLEKMASKLPISSSKNGPMPEIMGGNAFYFDPGNVADIEAALTAMISSAELRGVHANELYEVSKTYDWQICASETIDFICKVFDSRGKECVE